MSRGGTRRRARSCAARSRRRPLVLDVVDVGSGGGPVAAAWPGAVLVAQDDRAADVARDRVGEPDVQWQRRRAERVLEQAGAQRGGQPARAGHEVDGEAGDRVAVRLPCLGGQSAPGWPAAASAMILSITLMSAWPVTTGTVSASQAATSASVPARYTRSPGSPSLALIQASSRSAAPGMWRSCEIGMCTIAWVSAPARSGTIRARMQQLAGLLQAVVEPLVLAPVVLRAALLAERLEDGGHGCGALGGQVAPDHARAAERGAQLEVAVPEVEVLVGVGPRGAPLLDRGGGDRRQVLQRRPGRGRLEQDLVGLARASPRGASSSSRRSRRPTTGTGPRSRRRRAGRAAR